MTRIICGLLICDHVVLWCVNATWLLWCLSMWCAHFILDESLTLFHCWLVKYYRLSYFSCTPFVSYVFINVGTFSRFRALCNICTPFQYSHALPINLPCECHHFHHALTVPFNNIQHCCRHQKLYSLFIHLLLTCENSVKLFSLPVFFGNVHNIMFPKQSNIILSYSV